MYLFRPCISSVIGCRARDFKQSVDNKTEWTAREGSVFVLYKSAVMNLVQIMRFLHPPKDEERCGEAGCGAVQRERRAYRDGSLHRPDRYRNLA